MARGVYARTFRRLFRFLIASVILAILIIFAWRFAISGTPKKLKGLSPNDVLKETYLDLNGDIRPFTQKHITVTRADNCYGYFSVTQVIFIPEAKQVQVVFRYNTRTLEYLTKDYELAEKPERDADLYDLTLVRTSFTTEDKDEEKVQENRIFPTSVEKYQKNNYMYRKVIFDSVDIDEDTAGIFLDIYYVQDVHYDRDAYGTLALYDYTTRCDPYSMSRKEKSLLQS